MNGHAHEWIDAYLDGELSASQKRQVEAHLAQCPHCHDLLEQRRCLSALLQEVPLTGNLKPETQFIAEVGLRLGLREDSLHPYNWAINLGWLLIPVSLLLAWVFIQAVFILSGIVGFIPGAEEFLARQVSIMPFSLALPGLVGELLEMLGVFNLLNWNWLTGLVALLLVGLLYVCWMAGWWARNRSGTLGLIFVERS